MTRRPSHGDIRKFSAQDRITAAERRNYRKARKQ
jgi:hypothetical protein